MAIEDSHTNCYLGETQCVAGTSAASQSRRGQGRRLLVVLLFSHAQLSESQHCLIAPASRELDRPSAPLMTLLHILALCWLPGYAVVMSPPNNMIIAIVTSLYSASVMSM